MWLKYLWVLSKNEVHRLLWTLKDNQTYSLYYPLFDIFARYPTKLWVPFQKVNLSCVGIHESIHVGYVLIL